MITANDILNFQDYEKKEITVPEWGDMKLIIRSLTAKDFIGLTKLNGADRITQAAHIIIAGVIDESGKKVFTDKHIESLSQKSFSALDYISEQILIITGATSKTKKK